MLISIKRFSVAAALAALAFTSISSTRAADQLTIGSKAPALQVEHWVHEDKCEPVTNFKPGKVYVVEFWATWCGPCVTSMPHLAELQKKYADQGVRIISISDEDLETVERFLERPVSTPQDAEQENDDEQKTYRELTSAYCLTTDPDGSSSEDYMEAAGQGGIPTSFVVGKDSKIEWIGHPMDLDDILKAVLNDKWDREAFAAEFKARQEAELAMQKIGGLVQNQEFDKALELIDGLIKNDDDIQLKMMKLQILLMAKKSEAAVEHVKKLYASLSDDPATVNMLAWNLYEMTSQLKIEEEGLAEASIAASEKAIEKADKETKASLMDTLAHYLFKQGELDKAIELETEAAKITGPRDREFIETFLEELKAAKAEKEGKQQSDAEPAEPKDK